MGMGRICDDKSVVIRIFSQFHLLVRHHELRSALQYVRRLSARYQKRVYNSIIIDMKMAHKTRKSEYYL